jgi:hypothetical protein
MKVANTYCLFVDHVGIKRAYISIEDIEPEIKNRHTDYYTRVNTWYCDLEQLKCNLEVLKRDGFKIIRTAKKEKFNAINYLLSSKLVKSLLRIMLRYEIKIFGI